MAYRDDPLAAARGVWAGLAVALVLWSVVLSGLIILLRWWR